MDEIVSVSAMGSRLPSQRRMAFVIGQTGSGKSTLANAYLKNKTRVLILDAAFQEYGAIDFTPPHGAGFDPMADYLEKHSHPSHFFKVSYTPTPDEYGVMCDLARAIGPVEFVIEESDRLPEPRYLPEYGDLIARGRHYGVSMLNVTRHPFAIPVDVRREATHIYAFRMQEPRDIDWLREVIGDAALELPQLAQHEFIEWTQEKGALPRRKLTL